MSVIVLATHPRPSFTIHIVKQPKIPGVIARSGISPDGIDWASPGMFVAYQITS
jgi:hypothetical protein